MKILLSIIPLVLSASAFAKNYHVVTDNIKEDYKISGSLLTVSHKFKDKLLGSYLSSASQQIRFRSIREQNQIKALKISKIEKGSVFDKAGLKLGDQILSINGKPISHPQNIELFLANAFKR